MSVTVSKTNFGTKYSEDNTINGTIERFDIEKGYNLEQLKVLPRESYVNRNGERLVGLKEYIERLRNERARYENEIEAIPNTSISSDNNSTESGREGSSAGRYGKSQLQSKSEGSSVAAANDISNTDNLDKGGESDERRDLSRIESLLAKAEAEDNRRLTSAVKLRDKYGIDKVGKISRENLSRMLRDLTNNENDIALFDKLMEDTKHLGIDFRFTYGLGSARGAANIYQNYISYNLDTFTREISDVDKATVIIHELLHQELQSTYLVNLQQIITIFAPIKVMAILI